MKKNPRFIQLLMVSVFLTFNCYAADRIDDKELHNEADKIVADNSLRKDYEILEKSALHGNFDKFDPTIRKDFLISHELMLEANAFDRKAKLAHEVADEFNKAGFQHLIFEHNYSAEFNKVSDKEISKIRKINPKTTEEKEGLFREVALRGRFDRFDVTIRKFFEVSDKERLEADKYDQKVRDLFLQSKKYKAQGFAKIAKIPSEKLEISNNSGQN